MSTSQSNDNDDVIPENTTIQDEAQMEQDVSEPQENETNETELLIVKKKGKRKKEQVPLKENARLIQLVRCMRCLYDPQHPRHQDTEVCKDLWDIIGKSMDLPGNECAKRWSTLKKKFKNIIKSKKKGNSPLAKSLTWYEEYMQIIIDREMKKGLDYPRTSKCSCRKTSHDIDVFLSGLLPTLKSLTPAEQDLAKTQIFDVVNKYEQSSLNIIEIKIDVDWTE